MTYSQILVYILIGLLVRTSMTYIHSFYMMKGWTAESYRHKKIPLGYGIVVPIFLWLFVLVWFCLGFNTQPVGPSVERYRALLVILFCSGVALAGWLDDRIGDNKIKGFSGHWRAFCVSGRATTGMIKAVTGLMMAMCTAFFTSKQALDILLNIGLIALSINTINLLDVRPGRALKGFWLLQIVIVLFGTLSFNDWSLFLASLVITIAVATYDFSALAMMGDTGSNSLGFLAGFFCSVALPFTGRVMVLLIFCGLHWYAEKTSLSLLIENNKWLNQLDRWGR